MSELSAPALTTEEELVAELELMGVSYLSRQTTRPAQSVRPPHQLLADLVRQPSARVRAATIAVLLAHPELAEAVPDALDRLTELEQLTLQFFYTAAVLLQEQYASLLEVLATNRQVQLPDLFSAMQEVPSQGTLRTRLRRLGNSHRRATGVMVNWTGTYEHTARQLLRRWKFETQW